MDDTTREEIANTFSTCIRNTIRRLQAQDGNRPFHSRLIPSQAIFWSRFERSFSTSLGQSVIERVSELVAQSIGSSAERQRVTEVTLTTTQWEAIAGIVRQGRTAGGSRPDWEMELTMVTAARSYGVPETRRVISDLWWDAEGIPHYMSIKTVKPNLDQTSEAKKDLLALAASNHENRVHFGLYSNPFGELPTDYSFSPPQRLFNFSQPPVLLGADYWNTLGGPGTYQGVLEIAEEVGQSLKPELEKYAATFRA